MKVLDLFSGIGGFSLGLERAGMETVAFCEINPFCRQVLRKHWPDVPIFEDVTKLRGEDVGPVDVICGGYPCQPFSTAGKRQGEEDDRHLWPEFSRLVAELRPAWVIGENVAGHVSMGLDQVLSDLERQGYTCRTFVIPACAVDAPHRRDRVWTVAAASVADCSGVTGDDGSTQAVHSRAVRGLWQSRRSGCPDTMADTDQQGSQGWAETRDAESRRPGRFEQPERCSDLPRRTWPPEPGVGRVAHGIPRRVDRLRALGNAVVPQIPEMLGRAIMEAAA